MNVFTGDLLAVAFESCNADVAGLVGVQFYDVSNPAAPVLRGFDNRFVGNTATRDVSLVQRPDGRVLAFESFANGVAVNATGTRAYAAYQDQGVLTLDASNAATGLPRLGQALYAPSEEGNSLRFVPNAAETAEGRPLLRPPPSRTRRATIRPFPSWPPRRRSARGGS